MRYWVLCFALCLGLAWTTPDAGSHPQDYFQAPVDFPIRLSGTFGELRPGHFHSGMDIKPSTTGAGDPVLAAADGHIVRIAVTSGGYGNALYIQHNNGYQTVYAHMQGFIPTIAGYVLKEQYRLHSFEVNLYPSASLFPVKQGEPIGIWEIPAALPLLISISRYALRPQSRSIRQISAFRWMIAPNPGLISWYYTR